MSWDKAQWRAWARQERARLPDVSDALVATLLPWLAAQGARTVLAYHALPGEGDLSGLAGHLTLLTTRTHWQPPRLTLHPWALATERSRFGALEPPRDAPQVPLESVDVALLPALAYDRWGVRLGYGGGFYDRLRWAGHTQLVGVTPAALVVPRLPREAHDRAVGWLATERGVQRV